MKTFSLLAIAAIGLTFASFGTASAQDAPAPATTPPAVPAPAASATMKLVIPAVARNIAQICNDDWSKCKEADKVHLALFYCIDFKEKDIPKLQILEVKDRKQFIEALVKQCTKGSSFVEAPPILQAENEKKEQPLDQDKPGAKPVAGTGNCIPGVGCFGNVIKIE